jgi:hypothetical protein
MALFPPRYKCLDLLELERIKVNPQTNTITFDDPQLAADYRAVAGWLQGWFTAWNLNPSTDGDVTKGTTTYQMIVWTFSYCRAHPSETLVEVALQLLNALRRDSTTRR